MQQRILVLDTITGPSGNFVGAMQSVFGEGGYTHVRTEAWPPDNAWDYTHLLISGSALMAGEAHENDSLHEDIILDFVSRGRCVLGICYGHQMIVRALAGIQHITRCPEFGLHRIQLSDNPLFEGVGMGESNELVSLASHFEEVSDLPDDFTVIATGEPCGVQAVQYRDLPVWGVQFHPEYPLDIARDKTRRNMEKYDLAKRIARDEEIEAGVYNALNRRIFNNWLKARPRN